MFFFPMKDEKIMTTIKQTAKQKFRQLKPPTIVTTFTSEQLILKITVLNLDKNNLQPKHKKSVH